MKNQRTLIIASFLLVLCVLEKEASSKAEKSGSVENVYNTPYKGENDRLTSTQISGESDDENNLLYNPAHLFEFASVDSTSKSGGSSKSMNHTLLNISAGNKFLD